MEAGMTESEDEDAIITEQNPEEEKKEDQAQKREGGKLEIEVHETHLQNIKIACRDKGLPLIKEYDYKYDTLTHNIKIELKTDVNVREY
jgi:hypothetical protein